MDGAFSTLPPPALSVVVRSDSHFLANEYIRAEEGKVEEELHLNTHTYHKFRLIRLCFRAQE